MELSKSKYEGVICELNESLKFQQHELDNKIELIKQHEEAEKQLEDEIEELNSGFEVQGKRIEELEIENELIPKLSSEIKSCCKRIEEISNEIDMERKKNMGLMNEREKMMIIIEDLKAKCSGENSPEHIKERIYFYEQSIKKIEIEKEAMSNRIAELEISINKEKGQNFEEENIITEELGQLLDYLEDSFADVKTAHTIESGNEKRPKNSRIALCIDELKKYINKVRIGVEKNLNDLEKQNTQLKAKLKEYTANKNDAEKIQLTFEAQKNKEENISLIRQLNILKTDLEKKKVETDSMINDISKELSMIIKKLNSIGNNNKIISEPDINGNIMEMIKTISKSIPSMIERLNKESKLEYMKLKELHNEETNQLLKSYEEKQLEVQFSNSIVFFNTEEI